MNYNYEQRIVLTQYILDNIQKFYMTAEEVLNTFDKNGVIYNEKIMPVLKTFAVMEGYTIKELVIDILKKTSILIPEWLLEKEVSR